MYAAIYLTDRGWHARCFGANVGDFCTQAEKDPSQSAADARRKLKTLIRRDWAQWRRVGPATRGMARKVAECYGRI